MSRPIRQKRMREIKFRGKSLNTGEWVKGYYLVNRGRHYIAPDEFVNPLAEPSDYEVAPDTIGQYTGLKDSEGREIYEGDIVRFAHNRQNKTSTVAYRDGAFSIGIRVWADGKVTPISVHAAVKVIGNIHDSPELLE